MRVVTLILSVCIFSGAYALDLAEIESCYKERSSKIPSQRERDFLDSYFAYMKNGTKDNGALVIRKMQDLAKEQGGQFSVKWAGIFDGSPELCCGSSQNCTVGVGEATLKAFRPKVEKGWSTAIDIVLMYERLAKTDGADQENLTQYVEVIKEKFPWAHGAFRKTYIK